MTAEIPSSKPPCYRDDAMEVLLRLRDAGHVAYFAGGCVRDLLMGLDPKDYDVATDAPPDKVRKLFRNTQAVGAAFGVVLVKIGRSVVEVATFRADGRYLDGRRPSEVRFTNAEEDAHRRDFTINGIFLDPAKHQFIDFVGGQADIQSKTLRAIGNPAERFDEDYLRMLRAVRFAARFHLTVDPATADAIHRNAPQLAQISPERIAEELRAMMTPPTRLIAWQLLEDLGLTAVIFRKLPALSQSSRRIKLIQALPANTNTSFGLTLAAMTLEVMSGERSIFDLLDPANIRQTAHACRVLLKISNEELDAMIGAQSVVQLLQPQAPGAAVMKRFLATSTSSDARMLLGALARLSIQTERIVWLEEAFASFPPDTIAPPPFLTGDDLIAAGLRPGKSFKTLLDRAYDLQLEGRLSGKSEALAKAIEWSRS
jgi:poly(A) polymerase